LILIASVGSLMGLTSLTITPDTTLQFFESTFNWTPIDVKKMGRI
jgi:hypothetical protein